MRYKQFLITEKTSRQEAFDKSMKFIHSTKTIKRLGITLTIVRSFLRSYGDMAWTQSIRYYKNPPSEETLGGRFYQQLKQADNKIEYLNKIKRNGLE